MIDTSKVVKLHNKGFTPKDIANRLHMTTGGVYYHLAKANVSIQRKTKVQAEAKLDNLNRVDPLEKHLNRTITAAEFVPAGDGVVGRLNELASTVDSAKEQLSQVVESLTEIQAILGRL